MAIDWQRLAPAYWCQNERTCPVWSDVLDRAIDRFGVSEIGRHICTVGPLTVWIANWPYAYGKSYGKDFPPNGLPTVRVRKKLRNTIRAALLAQIDQWPDTVNPERNT